MAHGTVPPNRSVPSDRLSTRGWNTPTLLVGLVLAAAMTLGGVLWWQARLRDDFAIASAQRIVLGAIGSRTEVLTNLLLDYAIWDDAFTRLGGEIDLPWADATLSSWVFNTGDVDFTFVTERSGRIAYAGKGGRRADGLIGTDLSRDLVLLLADTTPGGHGASHSGLVLIGEDPAIAVATPIRPATKGDTGALERILVFVDLLDHQLLDRWARHFGLGGLHWRTGTEPDNPGELTLRAVDGATLGVLTWQLELPGQLLLRGVMPAMLAALAGIALMALLVAHRSRSTASQLHRAMVQVHHDLLTGLPNRLMLEQRLAAAVRRAGLDGHSTALLYLDLDGFKQVNDSLGHDRGDALLVKVGRRLRETVREGDTVARIGGDEFAIVQVGVDGPEAIHRLCRRLLRAIATPFDLDGAEAVIGASIGVSIAPQDGATPATLLRLADHALYRAKASGRGTYCVHDHGRTVPRTLRIVEPSVPIASEGGRVVAGAARP